MTVVIHRLHMARVQCARLACVASLLFQCSTEKEAIDAIRLKGWRHEGSRTLCPKCVEMTRGAES